MSTDLFTGTVCARRLGRRGLAKCRDVGRGFAVAVLVLPVLSSLIVCAAAAAGTPYPPSRDVLARSIEARLSEAGNLIFPMSLSSDYVGLTVKPEIGFSVYAGLHSAQSFDFSVSVFKTTVQATEAYTESVEQVKAIGGDFHSYNIVRSGRVLYVGSTAGAPSPANPALPVKAFHALVALAAGRV